MDLAIRVRKAAEGLVMLVQAGRLTGESLRIHGAERPMLVSAVRKSLVEVDERECHDLADFIPLAFSRVALANMGVKFSDHYGRKDSKGRIREYRRLDENPVYREAILLATEWQISRRADVMAVAEWSGILDLVEQAKLKGSKLEDLELMPTLLDGPDSACPPLSERPNFPDNPWWLSHWKPKPWWKFW